MKAIGTVDGQGRSAGTAAVGRERGGELNLLLELPLRLVMAARSQGEPDGQAAKWSDRRTDGRTVARTRTRTDSIHR